MLPRYQSIPTSKIILTVVLPLHRSCLISGSFWFITTLRLFIPLGFINQMYYLNLSGRFYIKFPPIVNHTLSLCIYYSMIFPKTFS